MLRRLFVLAALLSLVCQSFGAVVGAWMCEGKTCSTSLYLCCCVAPTTQRDGTCRASTIGKKSCVGKCGCKLTVQSVRSPLPVTAAQKATFSVVIEVPALLPPTFELPTAPILDYAPALANPPPPVWGNPPLLEGAPLRAPPAPFV